MPIEFYIYGAFFFIVVSLHIIAFKHEIKDLKVRSDKNHVDENVSEHGKVLS